MLRTSHFPLMRRSRPTGRPTVRLCLVQLEDRTVLTAYTPAQIVAAYGFNQINFNLGATSVPGDGSGQTIAIVDAYADPHIASDLAAFSGRVAFAVLHAVFFLVWIVWNGGWLPVTPFDAYPFGLLTVIVSPSVNGTSQYQSLAAPPATS